MFGKKSRKPAVIHTLIGDSTRVDGDLHFDGGCHIDGVVNGNVSGGNDPDAYLSVSEYGKVQGNVNVPRLGLSGTVEGNVEVTERAELGPTARVVGDVYYNLIEIAAGAEINGKLIHVEPGVTAPARAPETASHEDEALGELAGAAGQGT